MVRQIAHLTPAQSAKLRSHADRWVDIGLRTGPADRPAFEAAAQRCYKAAGLPWHGNVVWVGSPLALVLAAPITALLTEWVHAGHFPPCGSVRGSLRDVLMQRLHQVQRAVGEASDLCVLRELADGLAASSRGHELQAAVRTAVTRASGVAEFGTDSVLRDSVRCAVCRAVRGAAYGSVDFMASHVVAAVVDCAIDGVAIERVDGRLIWEAIIEELSRPGYFPGQLWIGHWNVGPVYTSFMREVCGLELEGGLWEDCVAYEQTVQSACWWYPHREFVMVSERPCEIHREIRMPARQWSSVPPSGLHESFQLHHALGPAMSWPDGFRIHADHGRVVPGWVIESPQSITVAAIEAQSNAEVRRVMLERYGWARYIRDCGALVVDEVPEDHPTAGLRGARLLRKELPGEPEPLVYLEMVNSTPEPDGTCRRYLERIDPKAYDGDAGRLCHAAMASRWHHRDEQGELRLTFVRWQDYVPTAES
jgi:hypothetical protein